jgi:hypothetical protein
MYAKKFRSIEGAWRMFNKIMHAATLRYGHLECHDIGACEMQARPGSTGTNATQMYVIKSLSPLHMSA